VTAVALLIIIALQFVPPGRASILIYTTPLWVTPLAVVLLHERLTPLRAAGLVVGTAGVAVLFNPLAFDWSDPEVILGNALLLLAAFAWAVTIVHVRGHTWHATPLQLLPWQLGIAVVVMVPLALALEAGQSVEWSGTLIAIVLYSGLIAAAYCNWGIITVNRALPATTTALLTLGVPVCGVLFSSAMVDEPLDATTVVGLSLILAGLTAVTLGERRRNGRTTAVPLGIAQDDAPLP
jgi:drug/metabolite transporter (DMT)-like permease